MDHKLLTRPTEEGNIALHVIMEQYSKWVHIIPVPDVGSLTTARFIFKHIWLQWPSIRGIISDRVTSFINRLIPHLESMIGVKHFFSASLEPTSHGQIERKMSSLQTLLNKYCTTDKYIESKKHYLFLN